jgi:hypothetical protein
MLEAREVVVDPRPLLAIGISRQSFGYFYLNDRAAEGTEILGSFANAFVPEEVRSMVLPGNPLLTGWYLAMAWLERKVGRRYGLHADGGRYRYLQVARTVQLEGLRAMRGYWGSLSIGERLRFALRLTAPRLMLRVLPKRLAWRVLSEWMRRESPWPPFHPEMKTVGYATILELFEATPSAANDLEGPST